MNYAENDDAEDDGDNGDTRFTKGKKKTQNSTSGDDSSVDSLLMEVNDEDEEADLEDDEDFVVPVAKNRRRATTTRSKKTSVDYRDSSGEEEEDEKFEGEEEEKKSEENRRRATTTRSKKPSVDYRDSSGEEDQAEEEEEDDEKSENDEEELQEQELNSPAKVDHDRKRQSTEVSAEAESVANLPPKKGKKRKSPIIRRKRGTKRMNDDTIGSEVSTEKSVFDFCPSDDDSSDVSIANDSIGLKNTNNSNISVANDSIGLENETKNNTTKKKTTKKIKAKKADSIKEPVEYAPFKIEKVIARRSQTLSDWKETCLPMQSSVLHGGSRWVQEDRLGAENETEERYFIKWSDCSYLHCSWESRDDLLESVEGARNILARFDLKHPDGLAFDADERCDGDYFDPAWVQVDRVIEIHMPEACPSVSADDEDNITHKELGIVLDRNDAEFENGVGRHLLVKWENQPYSSCSYEYERDLILLNVDYKKQVQSFSRRNDLVRSRV